MELPLPAVALDLKFPTPAQQIAFQAYIDTTPKRSAGWSG